MRVYALDWAYNEKKIAVFDGKKIYKSLPKLSCGDIVVCENIPDRLAEEIWARGAKILTCHPLVVADFRKNLGAEKGPDELDAALIWQLYHHEPHHFRERKETPKVLRLWRAFKKLQKDRVRIGQRLWALGEDKNKDELHRALRKAELRLLQQITKELEKIPIWTEWLRCFKGIGASVGGGIIGHIQKHGIENFPTVSALWHYAGLHVVNGLAVRRAKGHRITYNPEFKYICMGLLADKIVAWRLPRYRKIYDREKKRWLNRVFEPGELRARYGERYKENDIKLRPGHVELISRRKAVKEFLADLWVIWRALEDLPVVPPYLWEHLKHKKYEFPPCCPSKAVRVITEMLANTPKGKKYGGGGSASPIMKPENPLRSSTPTKSFRGF